MMALMNLKPVMKEPVLGAPQPGVPNFGIKPGLLKGNPMFQPAKAESIRVPNRVKMPQAPSLMKRLTGK
jgi:hypothetical protein